MRQAVTRESRIGQEAKKIAEMAMQPLEGLLDARIKEIEAETHWIEEVCEGRRREFGRCPSLEEYDN